jgi:hypothetical protein
MIRICPAAHPSGFPSMSAAPAISIVLFEGGDGDESFSDRSESPEDAYEPRFDGYEPSRD